MRCTAIGIFIGALAFYMASAFLTVKLGLPFGKWLELVAVMAGGYFGAVTANKAKAIYEKSGQKGKVAP